jgi:phage shock protein A
MFGAIGRWFRSLGYFLSGNVDASRRSLDTNPHVVAAKYDDVIRDKTSRFHQFKQAVAALIAQQEGKIQSAKKLAEEIKKLETLKAGALAKAKKKVEELKGQGVAQDQIRHNDDYMKCLSAYNDFTSTLKEKTERVEELEKDVEDYAARIQEHKLQMQALKREIEDIREESKEAVADVISAKEEKEISDALAGLAEDGSDADLQELRKLRTEMKAEARISKELAGGDTLALEEEFLKYARESEHSDEFDALIGLAESAESGASDIHTADTKKSEKLPGLPE